jgi:hypothetical protein
MGEFPSHRAVVDPALQVEVPHGRKGDSSTGGSKRVGSGSVGYAVWTASSGGLMLLIFGLRTVHNDDPAGDLKSAAYLTIRGAVWF